MLRCNRLEPCARFIQHNQPAVHLNQPVVQGNFSLGDIDLAGAGSVSHAVRLYMRRTADVAVDACCGRGEGRRSPGQRALSPYGVWRRWAEGCRPVWNVRGRHIVIRTSIAEQPASSLQSPADSPRRAHAARCGGVWQAADADADATYIMRAAVAPFRMSLGCGYRYPVRSATSPTLGPTLQLMSCSAMHTYIRCNSNTHIHWLLA